jgi:hypothetical protein
MSIQRPSSNLIDTVDRMTKKSCLLQEHIVSVVNSLLGVLEKAEEDISAFDNPESTKIS